jgi:S1-C subfamily serine protease
MSYYEPEYYPPYYRPPRRQHRLGWLWLLLPVVLVVGVGWLAWAFLFRGSDAGPPLPEPVVARGSLRAEQKRAEAIYKKTSPSVVHVTRLAARRDRITLDLRSIPEGTGSGFVWDKKGHVVTNNHVIADVSYGVSVTLPDHSTWDARVVDAFPDRDLAVLHIDAPKEKLHPIALGSSSDLKVGQSAYAIGNPFGLDHSLTTGVLSALQRSMRTENDKVLKNVIQTSAPVNPGNSGGPLLDSDGRLIGVTTAILSPSGAWAGVAFAIPADEVNQVVTRAIRKPRPVRPALGVTLAPPQLQSQLGAEAPLVLDVLPGSAAEKAGLRPTRRTEDGDLQLGDQIVAVGGKAVRSLGDVRGTLGRHKVGETVPVTVLRDGDRLTVNVRLEAGR